MEAQLFIVRFNRHKIGCWGRSNSYLKLSKCLFCFYASFLHTGTAMDSTGPWTTLWVALTKWLPLTVQWFFVFQELTRLQTTLVSGGLLQHTCGNEREAHHRSIWQDLGEWNVIWTLEGSNTEAALHLCSGHCEHTSAALLCSSWRSSWYWLIVFWNFPVHIPKRTHCPIQSSLLLLRNFVQYWGCLLP